MMVHPMTDVTIDGDTMVATAGATERAADAHVPPSSHGFVRVQLESPFAPQHGRSIEDNLRYARLCMHDCLMRGEAPFASHLLYTQDEVLDDAIAEEREAGISAGFAYLQVAQRTVVYIDHGISNGMRQGIEYAKTHGIEVEYRLLDVGTISEDDVVDLYGDASV